MYIFKSSLFLMLLIIAYPLNAQIVGDESLRKLEQGDVSFVEGEFIAFLDDTVSPSFIQSEFRRLNYFLTHIEIEPVLISIINEPSDSTLHRLKSHPEVSNVFFESVRVDTSRFETMISEQGLTGEEYEKALARPLALEAKPARLYEFDYSVNEARLKEIMKSFRNVAYTILKNSPRSVNIKCEPGTEQETMSKVEQLPYVHSTALIGMINN